ncbi:hypothetical protein [Galbitalea soli]|uniref:Uncharacterized protein n=1 Tax=Galbitalea soli TaxID=1268042 RepID=A0A7C9PME0_9MICO|nr:hypothetical protein [Galbitalea soli]NEM90910.1 hypothetical protein [Galbitalea soli]NYJ31635.1 hypothetical protein [Galbitalea soli]
MSKHTSRRYRKAHDRRVWVFSQLNHDLRPEQIARIIVAASLAQAQREADARRATTETRAEESTTDADQSGASEGGKEAAS